MMAWTVLGRGKYFLRFAKFSKKSSNTKEGVIPVLKPEYDSSRIRAWDIDDFVKG